MSVELPTKVVDVLPKNPEEKSQQVDKQVAQIDLKTTDALEKLATDTEVQLQTKPEINELSKDLGDAKTNLNSLADFVKKNPEAKNIPENQKEILDIFGGWHLYGSLIKSILNSKKAEYNILKNDQTIDIQKLKSIISNLESEYTNNYQNFQISDFDKFISQKVGGVNVFDAAENNLVKTLDSTKSGDNIYKKYIYQNRNQYLNEMENFLIAYNSYQKKPSSSTDQSTTSNFTTTPPSESGKDINTGTHQPTYPTSSVNKQDQIKDFLTQNAGKIGLGGLGILGLYLIFRKKNKENTASDTTQDTNSHDEKGSFFKTLLKWGGIGAVGFFAYNWFKKQMGSPSSAPNTPTNDTKAQKSMATFFNLSQDEKKQYDDIGKNIDNFFDARLPKSNISGLWIGSFDNSYDDKTLPGYITYLSSGKTVDQTLKGQEDIKKAIDANSSGSEFVDQVTKGTLDLNSLGSMASLYAFDIAKKYNIAGAAALNSKYESLKNTPIIGKVLGFLKTISSGKQITQEDINTFFKGQLQENPNFYQEFSAIILGQFLKTQKYFLDKKNIILYGTIKKNIPADFILPSGKKYGESSIEEKSLAIQQILNSYNTNGEIDKNLKTILDKLNIDFKNSTITGKDNFQKFFTPEILANSSEYDKILATKDKLAFGEIEQKIGNIIGENNIFETKNLDSGNIKGILGRFETQVKQSESNFLENILGSAYAFGGVENLKNSILEKFKNPELTKLKTQISALKSKSNYTQADLDNLKELISEYGSIEKEAAMLKDSTGLVIENSSSQEQFAMKIALAANHFSSSRGKAIEAIKDMTLNGNIKDGILTITSLKFGEKVDVIAPIAIPLMGLKAVRFLTSPVKMTKLGLITGARIINFGARKFEEKVGQKAFSTFLKTGSEFALRKFGARAGLLAIPGYGEIALGLFMVGDMVINKDERIGIGKGLVDFFQSKVDHFTGWDKVHEDSLNSYINNSKMLFQDITQNNSNLKKNVLEGIKMDWENMGAQNRKSLIQSTTTNILATYLATDPKLAADPNSSAIIEDLQKNMELSGIQENGSGAKLSFQNTKYPQYANVLEQTFSSWYNPFMLLNTQKVA